MVELGAGKGGFISAAAANSVAMGISFGIICKETKYMIFG